MPIKKNTLITMPTWASHHNPEFFPEPEVFRPERFLKENSDEIIPYTFRPFGAGPRICIGKRFAMVEMMIAMAKILKNFKIERTEETKLELKKGNLFLLSFDGINVKLVNRE
jgi:cytochrome P450